MTNYRYLILFVIAVALLLAIILFMKIPAEQNTLLNQVGVLGTIASVLGLVLTYIQVLSIKETTVKTKKAVDDSINRVNEILTISELSKGIKNIELIQNSIKSENFDLAEILMKDLKSLLIQTKHIRDFATNTGTGEFQTLLLNLAMDINNLRQLDNQEGIEIDHFKIMSNLDDVSSVLIELENKLKFKTHDTGTN
jgi:hypothetical protein